MDKMAANTIDTVLNISSVKTPEVSFFSFLFFSFFFLFFFISNHLSYNLTFLLLPLREEEEPGFVSH